MKWSLTLILTLFVGITAMAGTVDDQYVKIYDLIQQGDTVSKSQPRLAAEKYLEAQTELKALQNVAPNWNKDVVSYRLNYLTDKLKEFGKYLPAQPPATQTNLPPAKPTTQVLEQQLGELQQQIAQLNADNAKLEAKLKEALSARPAAADPQELAKANEKIAALTKERDLLAVTLEQKKKAKPTSKSHGGNDVASLREQLAAAQDELDAVKRQSMKERLGFEAQIAKLQDTSAAPRVSPAESENVSALTRERNELKKRVDSLTKDLAEAEARRDEAVLAAKSGNEKVRDESKEEHVQKASYKDNSRVAELQQKILQLSDRLAVYEAKPVGPSAEELALLKKADKQPAPAPKNIHSVKDLSDNARALMAEGQQFYVAKDYKGCEAKFRQALKDDPNNIYIIAHVANVEMTAEKYGACEKTLKRALAVDPDDAACLYILGKLRLRQDKVDEALDALSRSARVNPTNAMTENALGSALSRKGMRQPAESALRKALEIEPDYADAHHNLALVYATDNPPSIELAKWHYKKAIDDGYPKDPELEKLLK